MLNIIITVAILSIILIVLEILHNSKYALFLLTNNKIVAVLIAVIYGGADYWVNQSILYNSATISYTPEQKLIAKLISYGVATIVVMFMNEKLLKEYIWKYEISVKYNKDESELLSKFEEHNIEYSVQTAWYKYEQYYRIVVYAWGKKGSQIIKNILSEFGNRIKYTILKTGSIKENSHLEKK